MSAVALGQFQQSGSSGRYYPIAKLGRGGMSEVYLAVARGPAGFNKLVVIKRLLPSLVAERHFLEMFLDEARLAARLNHPNIVQTNEVGASGQTYFMAMEYLDGQPLVKIIERLKPRPIPVKIALSIAADVCAGLQYAHTLTDFGGGALGIVHRDVSPHNIFVTYAGQVKVVDFGVAKAAGQTTETVTGALKGKIAYMSPEQIEGAPVDGRADIFALGVVLYEIVTGQRIWGSNARDVDIVRRLATGDVPCSPRAIAPDVPEDVDRICQRALAVDRSQRYATALEMQKDLEASIARLPQPISERDIGNMIAGMFEQERQTISRVIDRQVSLMDAAAEEFTLGSLPTLSSSGAITSFPPIMDGSAPRLRASKSPWRRFGARHGGTVLVLAAVFSVLAAIAIWGLSELRPDRPRAAVEPPGAPVVAPAPSAALPAPIVSARPEAESRANEKEAVAAVPNAPPSASAASPRRVRVRASAPVSPVPTRRPPTAAAPRPSAASETPAPPPPRTTPAPTYGPLDDRH